MFSEIIWHSEEYEDWKHTKLRLFWHKYFDEDFFEDSNMQIQFLLKRVELFLFGTPEECNLDKSHRHREVKHIFEKILSDLECGFFTHLLADIGFGSRFQKTPIPYLHLPFRVLKKIVDEKFQTINAEKDLEKIIHANFDIEVDIDSEFISNIRLYEFELNQLLCCKVSRDFFHLRLRKSFFDIIARHKTILLTNHRKVEYRADFLCNIYINSSRYLESCIKFCVNDAVEFDHGIKDREYEELLLLMRSLVRRYFMRITFNPYPDRLAHYEWICDNVGFKSRRRSLTLSLHKRLGLDKDTISTISQKICFYAGWI